MLFFLNYGQTKKKNLPLKSGILQDVEKYLADNPDVDLTIEEWNCAVQVMTFRWQYLQNCTVPGATRYDLYGKPAGTVKKHTQLMRNWFSMPVRKPARRNN
ncbi:ProQ/FINO family protein [Escherichia coli]|nr:ProQ/FINO family protein [Escherichia coli]